MKKAVRKKNNKLYNIVGVRNQCTRRKEKTESKIEGRSLTRLDYPVHFTSNIYLLFNFGIVAWL